MAQAPETLLVVYDFDQTISCDHVYHKLDNMSKSSRGQPRGQLEALSGMSEDDIRKLFGGKDRVTRLNLHFGRVTSSAEVAIVSFGYVEVIKKALEQMNLYNYFENGIIVGCDSSELKNANGSKDEVINKFKKDKKLNSDQVLFVDDDPSNIRKANNRKACKCMEVKPRKGMSNKHMDDIEEMVGVANLDISSLGKNGKKDTNDANGNETNSNNNDGDSKDNKTENGIEEKKKGPMADFQISEKNNEKLNRILNQDNDSEGSPVVEVTHDGSESEGLFVLAPPTFPNGNSNSSKDASIN